TYPQNPGPQNPGPQQPGQQPNPGQQPYPGQPYPAQQQQPYPGQPSQPFPAQPQQPYGQPQQQPYGQPSQPFGAQPPQPYGQQPFPAYPGGPGSIQAPKPGGGTAITAAVLAILGGIVSLISLIGSIAIIVGVSGNFLVLGIVSLVVNLALAGLLLFGAITLIMHKPIGRMCVMIGCGLAIAYTVISLILTYVGVGGFGRATSALAYGSIGSILSILPPVATLILVIVKPTALWVGIGDPNPGIPQYPGGYSPQQGGGPQGW
ncbi:MAG: hypothetical protein ACRDZY_17915, partial [Acidimicrobiales bacterium]